MKLIQETLSYHSIECSKLCVKFLIGSCHIYKKDINKICRKLKIERRDKDGKV